MTGYDCYQADLSSASAGCRITSADGYLVETNLMGLLDFTTLVKSN